MKKKALAIVDADGEDAADDEEGEEEDADDEFTESSQLSPGMDKVRTGNYLKLLKLKSRLNFLIRMLILRN